MALKYKYILLNDRVGDCTERGLLSSKNVPTQLLRGEILEALVEAEQPEDAGKIVLTGIANKNLKLICPTADVARLSASEADLLMAITSAEEKHRIFRERNRLEPGKCLTVGSKVYVKVKGLPKEVNGVIWYKGTVLSNQGTMFGVELLDKDAVGHGTTDGSFRSKRYFECPQDCGVFVALDKLRPQSDPHQSPKKDTQMTSKSILPSLKDIIPSSFLSKDSPSNNKVAINPKLKIDQRVVVFHEKQPVGGYVRYIGNTSDIYAIGVELDQRLGRGTGMFRGHQCFVCKKGFAVFVPASIVLPEEDFYGLETENAQKLSHSDGLYSSLGYDANTRSIASSHQPIKRSNSATSITSRPKEEAMQIVGVNQIDKEKFMEEQRDMIALFEADKKRDGTNEENPMDFSDEHFNRSPSQETPNMRLQSGRSNFYVPFHPGDTQEKRGISYPEEYKQSTYYPVLSRGIDATHNNHYDNAKSSVPMMLNSNGHERNVSNTPNEPAIHTSDAFASHYITENTKTDTTAEMPVNQQAHGDSKGQFLPMLSNDKDDVIRSGLEVGSMVEVPIMEGRKTQYGVIRWIGKLPGFPDKLVAGLELEVEQPPCSDGVFNGQRYFTCPAGRGFFVSLHNCRRDSRFQPESPIDGTKPSSRAFGSLESPMVAGTVPPPGVLSPGKQGRMRGIQGHHNSCYLDATLYSMFAFTTVFDTLLYRSKVEDDLEEYDTVQKVLKEGIVNPLRSSGFVRADRVLQLRRLLDKLGSTSGLINEEKDPEEFLNTLLQQVLKSEPLLKLKTPNNRCEVSNYYQIITEKDETIKLATVQRLLEQSFFFSDLKLAEVPSCLILQMPRFGNKYKMYELILPELTLDVTHVLENVPRECSVCGTKVSTFECKECHQQKHVPQGIPSFCRNCNGTFHNHPKRSNHKPKPIIVPREFSQYASGQNDIFEKQTMDLFAVVCIATSHYVAFVKCGLTEESPWCFFDSMADRKGEINGYNIPVVTPCPEATKWLGAKEEEIISANSKGELPPSMKRLFGDAYMCFYQNVELTMYK